MSDIKAISQFRDMFPVFKDNHKFRAQCLHNANEKNIMPETTWFLTMMLLYSKVFVVVSQVIDKAKKIWPKHEAELSTVLSKLGALAPEMMDAKSINSGLIFDLLYIHWKIDDICHFW